MNTQTVSDSSPPSRSGEYLSAPEGPGRVARGASPWKKGEQATKPRRGDVASRYVSMSPLRGLHLTGRRLPGTHAPGYTTLPLRGNLPGRCIVLAALFLSLISISA